MGTSQLVRREKHFRAADGTLVPALVTSCLLPTSEDGDRELLDQVDWLTDQRRAEHRLLETHSALDAIVSVDARGRVISWNSGATRMFGYERDWVLGRSISLIVPERLTSAHERGRARLAAGGAPRLIGSTLDLPAVRSDGTEFPVELSILDIDRSVDSLGTSPAPPALSRGAGRTRPAAARRSTRCRAGRP